MILDRRYKDWNKQSYPKRMWLLKEIHANSNKNYKVSLGKMSIKIAPMRTIMKWVEDWVNQGYVVLLPRGDINNPNKNRFCEYKLTNKGEDYLNKYYKSDYANYKYENERSDLNEII